jgi:hypothetical protein
MKGGHLMLNKVNTLFVKQAAANTSTVDVLIDCIILLAIAVMIQLFGSFSNEELFGIRVGAPLALAIEVLGLLFLFFFRIPSKKGGFEERPAFATLFIVVVIASYVNVFLGALTLLFLFQSMHLALVYQIRTVLVSR